MDETTSARSPEKRPRKSWAAGRSATENLLLAVLIGAVFGLLLRVLKTGH